MSHCTVRICMVSRQCAYVYELSAIAIAQNVDHSNRKRTDAHSCVCARVLPCRRGFVSIVIRTMETNHVALLFESLLAEAAF